MHQVILGGAHFSATPFSHFIYSAVMAPLHLIGISIRQYQE